MTGTSTTEQRSAHAPAGSLVSVLGAQRAAIVVELKARGDASVAQLADHLGVSEVATRRHLAVLTDEGLVASESVAQPRGRPAARYHLTEAAGQLFPQRYDRLATEVLDFLTDEHGRAGLRAFLRWRLEREVAGLQDAVTAEDLHERLGELAAALSARGFAASALPEDGGFTLVQEHCAIADVAREHPEVCAYEAATFSEVLGRDVTLSRRETLAAGAKACVCHVAVRPEAAAATNGRDTTASTRPEASSEASSEDRAGEPT